MTRRPTLAVSTGPLWRMSLADVFASAHAVGADGVEVLVTQNLETQSAVKLEKLSNRYDLPIVAIHAPLLLLTRRVYTSDPLEKIRRTLELSKTLDVGVIVLHPPYLWQVRYSLWLLHELEEATSDIGTLVTMENMYPTHVANRRLQFHRYLELPALRRFDHITLDTSHLAVAREDILAAYRLLADKVAHVHLSDNRGKGRDSHAPLGEGILPIPEFVRALDGDALRSICLEINPGPGEGRQRLEKVLGESLELVRNNLPAPAPDP